MTITPDTFEARLAQLRALAEPTRLRIVRLLCLAELTVTELTVATGQSQPSVSRHLRVLQEASLVVRHAEGSWAFYRATLPPALDAATRDLDGAQVAADDARLVQLREAQATEAARYFADRAGDWDVARTLHGGARDVEAAVRAVAEQLAASAGGRLDRVLDLGTGTGRMLMVLDGLYAEAVGFDVSAAMLRVARANLYRAEAARARVRLGDLHDLDEAGGADLVVLHHVLPVLADPAAGIGAAARLAAGGHVLIADLAPHEDEGLRTDHLHRRLGFSDEQIAAWAAANDLRVADLRTVPPRVPSGLTAKLWCLSPPAPCRHPREQTRHAL